MWLVLKYKKNELNYLQHDLKKKLGNLPTVFIPKIKYQKLIKNKMRFVEREILDDYLICYHKEFRKTRIVTYLKNLKGLKYFLSNSL